MQMRRKLRKKKKIEREMQKIIFKIDLEEAKQAKFVTASRLVKNSPLESIPEK